MEALALAQAHGEENLAIDAAHMLGIVDPPDQAIQWHERAIQLAEAATDPQARRWPGPLYNNLGWTYHDRGDEALAIQRALAADGSGDGYVYEELGGLLLAQGKADAARPHFAQAYEMLSKDVWLAANEQARLERLRSLGQGR